MMLKRLLVGAAIAAILAGPVQAQTVLTPPAVRWGAGAPFQTPPPSIIVSYDSVTGLPCIVGSAATCSTSPGGSYTLMSNASATSTPVAGVAGGSYVWSCTGTFAGGATLTLQTLGPNGSTYVNVQKPDGTAATLTANGNPGVVIGSNATVRVLLTVGTISGMYCSLT